MKRLIVMCIFLILILVITIIIIIKSENNFNKEGTIIDENIEKSQPQTSKDLTQLVSNEDNPEIRRNEINQKIDSIIYGVLNCNGEIQEDYDEQKVNQSILEQFVKKNGIYISSRAREKILKLLKETTNIDYSIDKDGYLIEAVNNNDDELVNKINKLINGDKCIIIDYNQYYYSILANTLCTFTLEETSYLEKFSNEEDIIILVLNPIKYEQEYESSIDLINQIINNA